MVSSSPTLSRFELSRFTEAVRASTFSSVSKATMVTLDANTLFTILSLYFYSSRNWRWHSSVLVDNPWNTTRTPSRPTARRPPLGDAFAVGGLEASLPPLPSPASDPLGIATTSTASADCCPGDDRRGQTSRDRGLTSKANNTHASIVVITPTASYGCPARFVALHRASTINKAAIAVLERSLQKHVIAELSTVALLPLLRRRRCHRWKSKRDSNIPQRFSRRYRFPWRNIASCRRRRCRYPYRPRLRLRPHNWKRNDRNPQQRRRMAMRRQSLPVGVARRGYRQGRAGPWRYGGTRAADTR
jgi:hypothetical protein